MAETAEPKNKKRNTYRVDETLEEPFSLKHLKRAWIYIRKYKVKMTIALILSALGAFLHDTSAHHGTHVAGHRL